MKTYLDCLPCFMSQALRAARAATEDEKIIKKVMDEVGKLICQIPLESSPPQTGALIYQKVREITNNLDPYYEHKRINIKHALKLIPVMEKALNESSDRLETAIRLAIAGNVIDLGVDRIMNLEKDIDDALCQDFAFFSYEEFKAELVKAKHILYIGDNSGEAVFDKILIQEMKKPVTFAVRGIPVINDITTVEAEIVGISEVANVISSGSTAPGAVLELCDDSFVKEMHAADLIIAKGQGNYEALSECGIPIYFALKVKCKVIAQNIGAEVGDIVFQKRT